MSFSDDLRLARVPAHMDRCADCGNPPHPDTLEFYQIVRTGKKLCLRCFFEALGEERRRVQQSDVYWEAQKERQFTSILFMGSGDHSSLRKRDLCERLEWAIQLLGDTQQVPMCTDPEGSAAAHRKLCAEISVVLDATVRDIAMALTGKEWDPKEP